MALMLVLMSRFLGAEDLSVSMESTDGSAGAVPGILLLGAVYGIPAVDEVREQLNPVLEELQLTVRTETLNRLPERAEDWRRIAAEQAAQYPGTLAVVGWLCDSEECVVILTEGLGRTITIIPVKKAPQPIADAGDASVGVDGLIEPLAAVIREILYGPLLTELHRIVLDSESAKTVEKDVSASGRVRYGDRLMSSMSDDDGEQSAVLRLEAGYVAAYPYPDRKTVHGLSLGVAWYARRHLAPVVGIGWMGLRHHENPAGRIRLSTLPLTTGIRISFPVGIALFSLTPMLRMDLNVVRYIPTTESRSTSRDVDLVVGLMSSWCVPLPLSSLDAVFGFSLSGVLFSEAYSIEDIPVLPERTVEFMGYVGISWRIGQR